MRRTEGRRAKALAKVQAEHNGAKGDRQLCLQDERAKRRRRSERERLHDSSRVDRKPRAVPRHFQKTLTGTATTRAMRPDSELPGGRHKGAGLQNASVSGATSSTGRRRTQGQRWREWRMGSPANEAVPKAEPPAKPPGHPDKPAALRSQLGDGPSARPHENRGRRCHHRARRGTDRWTMGENP